MCIARKAISSLSDQPVCASHSAVGCLVTANQSDCRRPWPTTRNANRHSKLMMGTTQRSIAVMASVWLRRTVRQPCDGGARHLTMYLDTVDSATPKPSLSSSPWMRGAPYNGFSSLIRPINACSARSIFRLPGRPRDFQRQYTRNPARSHRRIVSC
jgi:hypothetical protein